MSGKELCARDLSILNLIFDPNQCEKDTNIKDSTQPIKDDIEAKDQEEDNSEEIAKSKALEVEGVQLTEAGNLTEALLKFNESISIAKLRPSPYNNRAQLYRFLENDDCKFDLRSTLINFSYFFLIYSVALVDLTRSIELSGATFPRTSCRAYCQRGIIKKKIGDVEGAREDFNESAKLGSKFARHQIADLNPYAQLCSQMVSKLLSDMK